MHLYTREPKTYDLLTEYTTLFTPLGNTSQQGYLMQVHATERIVNTELNCYYERLGVDLLNALLELFN